MPDIVRLSSTDRAWRDQVAAIHAAEIRLGALPLFGESFLARLYGMLASAPRTGVWGAIEDSRIVGFLCGCADVAATYRRVLLRGAVPLGSRAMVRVAVSTALRRRIGSVLSYAAGRPQAAGPTGGPGPSGRAHAELLSIAVVSGRQGGGLGSALVDAFEEALRRWRVERYWVSTNRDDAASNRFYRSCGFEPADTVAHHDLVLQRYGKRLAPAPGGTDPPA